MAKGLKIKLIVISLLFCVTSALLFVKKPSYERVNYSETSKEMYIPALGRLNSTSKVLEYTDSMYAALKLEKFDTSRYVRIVSGTVKRRFYHGLSRYSLSENWICYILGEICWSHISAIVDPEDILKYPEGLCSQQNIVFTEVLRKKGITFRSVGLGTSEGPGHFLSEVKYGNQWHLFDVDLEPNWGVINHIHESMSYLLAHKEILYKIYEGRISIDRLEKITQIVNYGQPNTFAAKNMLLFHRLTLAITYLLPCFLLVLFIWLYRKK